MKEKAVITDWGFPHLEHEMQALGKHGVEVVAFQCKTEEEVTEAVRDADVVLTQWAPVKANAIAAMERCRGIVRYGIGLDNVDLDAAKRHGIPVRNVPDYSVNEVADHTMALLLALQRQVCDVQALVKEGLWKITPPQAFPPLRNCTLGLIGFGRIARLVAVRARSFGMNLIAFDPLVDEQVSVGHGVNMVTLSDLLSQSDIVSLHCPLTQQTKHLMNARTLGQMKPQGLLINTSRGGLVETDALLSALKMKSIAGAALDVIEEEPLSGDQELLQFKNVIINSHIAWYSSQSVVELQRLATNTAIELLQLH
jgi:D-3-phosphoglycerate dehydrogenase / 2-oxoglutarate reductase